MWLYWWNKLHSLKSPGYEVIQGGESEDGCSLADLFNPILPSAPNSSLLLRSSVKIQRLNPPNQFLLIRSEELRNALHTVTSSPVGKSINLNVTPCSSWTKSDQSSHQREATRKNSASDLRQPNSLRIKNTDLRFGDRLHVFYGITRPRGAGCVNA